MTARRLPAPRGLVHSPYDKAAAVSALITLVFVTAHAALANVSEVFPGGARIGSVLYDFSLTYGASYIFYLVVVALPKLKDRRMARPVIFSGVNTIIGDGQAIMGELGHPMVNDPKDWAEPDIPSLCQRKKPTDGPKRMFPRINSLDEEQITVWAAIKERVDRSQEAIDRLLRLVPLLDAALIRLLIELEGCSIFSQLRSHPWILLTATNQDMSGWASSFEDYWELVKQLQDYQRRELMDG